MPNELLLLVLFKEKAITKLHENYLYCARKTKKRYYAKVDLCLHVPPKCINLIRQPISTVPSEMLLHEFLNETQIAA